MDSRRQLLFASLAFLAAFLLCASLGAPAGAQETPGSDLEPEALLEVESLLQRLGFAPGPVDGKIDEATSAAVARYQAFSFRGGPAEISRALLLELRGVAAALAPAEPARELAVEPVREPAFEVAGETGAVQTIAPDNQPGLKTLAELEKLVEPETPATMEPALEIAAAPEADFEPETEAPVEATGQNDEDEGLSPRTREILDGYRDDLAAGRRDPRPLAREFNLAGRGAFGEAVYEEAIALFSAAIALDPEFAAAYHNRGAAQQAAGRTAAAAADFEAAFTRGWNRLKLIE